VGFDKTLTPYGTGILEILGKLNSLMNFNWSLIDSFELYFVFPIAFTGGQLRGQLGGCQFGVLSKPDILGHCQILYREGLGRSL